MKNLQEAHSAIQDLIYELDNGRNSISDKLEYISRFIDVALDDIAAEIDSAIDRIEELEVDLKESQDLAEEWEEKHNALI